MKPALGEGPGIYRQTDFGYSYKKIQWNNYRIGKNAGEIGNSFDKKIIIITSTYSLLHVLQVAQRLVDLYVREKARKTLQVKHTWILCGQTLGGYWLGYTPSRIPHWEQNVNNQGSIKIFTSLGNNIKEAEEKPAMGERYWHISLLKGTQIQNTFKTYNLHKK